MRHGGSGGGGGGQFSTAFPQPCDGFYPSLLKDACIACGLQKQRQRLPPGQKANLSPDQSKMSHAPL